MTHQERLQEILAMMESYVEDGGDLYEILIESFGNSLKLEGRTIRGVNAQGVLFAVTRHPNGWFLASLFVQGDPKADVRVSEGPLWHALDRMIPLAASSPTA